VQLVWVPVRRTTAFAVAGLAPPRPPPFAVLRRRCRPCILPVEFAASSPTFWCDPRVFWGTLALRPASRRRSPSRASVRRRSPPGARSARACATSGPPVPQSTAQTELTSGQTGQCAVNRPPAPLSSRRLWIAIQRPDPSPYP
jgi:hypothetical protein